MPSGKIRNRRRIYKIDRELTRTARDLQAASRRQDHDAIAKLELRIHELGWEKEKLI